LKLNYLNILKYLVNNLQNPSFFQTGSLPGVAVEDLRNISAVFPAEPNLSSNYQIIQKALIIVRYSKTG